MIGEILSPARIRAIAAVAEEGSFAAAGRLLGLSHAAVSQHIRSFEADRGIALFDRAFGRLTPTPVCLEIVEIAERLRETEADLERLVARKDASGRARLRVGTGNAMPGIAIIARLLASHPSLSVTVETGSHQAILGAVLRREVDVGILPDLPIDPRFRRAPVLRQQVVAILGDSHPLAGRREISISDLADLPLVFRARGSSTQRVVDRAFARAGLHPDPALVADTRDAVYEAVSLGVGAGFMWGQGTVRRDGVHRVPVTEMAAEVEEAVFALAAERNPLIDLLFHAADQHRREI